MKWIPIVTTLLVTGAAGTARAQAPIDWKAVEAETLQHFQALVRIDTSNPPGNETQRGRVPEAGARQGRHPVSGVRRRCEARQPGRPHQGKRQEEADPRAGPHRRRHDRPEEVDRSRPVQRRRRRRLRLRPRHRRRQGQPGRQPDAGADAEAHQRRARSRRDLPRRVGRGRLARGGRAVHDRQALRRHRRRVLPGRRRRRRPRPAARNMRANISTTEKEPRAVEIIARGPAGHGSVPRQTNVVAHLSNAVAKIVAWTPQLRVNETTGSYFRKLAATRVARGGGALPRRAQPRSEGVEAGRRLDARERAGALVDAAHLGRADDSHRRATATT